MLDNQTKLNIAVTRFAGFASDLPLSPNEDAVSEYHDIVELFEQGSGLDLSQFRIAPDRLKPAAGTIAPGRPRYRTESSVDFRYFLVQVRGLVEYLTSVLGSRPC
jgi:hypothetical protein